MRTEGGSTLTEKGQLDSGKGTNGGTVGCFFMIISILMFVVSLIGYALPIVNVPSWLVATILLVVGVVLAWATSIGPNTTRL